VDNCPFPKSQFQEVGLPVDKSWNETINGEQPDLGVAEKFATGEVCPKPIMVNSKRWNNIPAVFWCI